MDSKHTTTITHLYNDEHGVSHFEDKEIASAPTDFAPPAPQVFVTPPTEAKRHLFLTLPGEWFGEAHPVPNKQIMTVLNGKLEVRASDGTVRTFSAGDTALVEDTEGEGHSTRNLSDEPLTLSVTQL